MYANRLLRRGPETVWIPPIFQPSCPIQCCVYRRPPSPLGYPVAMAACKPHTVSHLDDADPPPSSLVIRDRNDEPRTGYPQSAPVYNPHQLARCFQLMHLLDWKSSLGPNPAHCALILMRNKTWTWTSLVYPSVWRPKRSERNAIRRREW